MLAVHLIKTYCLSSALYSCDVRAQKTLGCCPVSERLAKQLSKKISASFELTGKPQWENFCLTNRSLTRHGLGLKSLAVAWNNAFRKNFNICWHESTRSLQFYCNCLPVPYLIDQCRVLFWKKVTVRITDCCWFSAGCVRLR